MMNEKQEILLFTRRFKTVKRDFWYKMKKTQIVNYTQRKSK